MKISKSINEPETILENISKEATDDLAPENRKAISEIEKIGDRILNVQFIDHTGKGKKKLHILNSRMRSWRSS